MRNLASSFVECKNGHDTWLLNCGKYLVSTVWNHIRLKSPKVFWSKLLWTSPSIPKHAIISWMALLNRLPTLKRLVYWGIVDNDICRLCSTEVEDRDHMFFSCYFFQQIWTTILNLYGLNTSACDWNSTLDWAIQKFKGKALQSIILRLAWRASIYCI
ncbi:hypothetical protein PTKIN_Ptkin07bG0087500 [Pterospermum kingtungense]